MTSIDSKNSEQKFPERCANCNNGLDFVLQRNHPHHTYNETHPQICYACWCVSCETCDTISRGTKNRKYLKYAVNDRNPRKCLKCWKLIYE